MSFSQKGQQFRQVTHSLQYKVSCHSQVFQDQEKYWLSLRKDEHQNTFTTVMLLGLITVFLPSSKQSQLHVTMTYMVLAHIKKNVPI